MDEIEAAVTDSIRERNSARAQTILGLENTPDQAVRAIQLARGTGADPNVIMGDLDNFDQSQRRLTAAEIVRTNPELTDYINANPIHAKLSNDDYGALDTVSQSVSKMSQTLPGKMFRMPEAIGKGIYGGLARGIPEGFGDKNIGSWIMDTPQGPDFVKHYPMSAALMITMASPIEIGLRSLNAGIKGITDATAGAAEEGYKSFGGSESEAARFGREMGGFVEFLTTDPGAVSHGSAQVRRPIENTVRKMESYIDQGIEPPRGIDKELDGWKAKRNVDDLKQLDDALSEAQKSQTRERDPDIFANFIAQHTDAKIGVSIDAIGDLYGSKVPEPGDGLLGWVPGLKDQIEVAKASGGDIQIPISDWLARVDPEVAKQLHDDTRVRPGGITKREVELAKDLEQTESLPEPVPTARAASALEPVFSIGDRKLRLEALEQSKLTMYGKDHGFHDFKMVDENGNDVGTINLSTQKGGKEIYVDMINGINGLGPRDFGPRLMRDLLRQIKEAFPEAETITGHRVSGAREKARSFLDKSATPVIRLDNPEGLDSLETTNAFRRLLDEGQWETFSSNVKAFIRPDAARNAVDTAIIREVREELARIVPREVQSVPADSIIAHGNFEGQSKGAVINPNGVYIPYREIYPVILYSLEGPDPIGTARHEAIHHLRRYGFFDDAEWGLLEASAHDQGWTKRFNIDKRYPTASTELRLEESIADAYKEWKAGRLENVTPEVQSIFVRFKELLDRIKARVAELIGKADPTWEDVFAKVDAGDIGSRTGNKPIDPRAFQERAMISPDQAAKLIVKVKPYRTNMIEPGEGPHRYLTISTAKGTELGEVNLAPYRDGYQVARIQNRTKWLNKGANNIPGIGEYAYVKAAEYAESQGKKLYAGASESTSYDAQRAHERLEQQGLASAADENGVREIYARPRGPKRLQSDVMDLFRSRGKDVTEIDEGPSWREGDALYRKKDAAAREANPELFAEYDRLTEEANKTMADEPYDKARHGPKMSSSVAEIIRRRGQKSPESLAAQVELERLQPKIDEALAGVDGIELTQAEKDAIRAEDALDGEALSVDEPEGGSRIFARANAIGMTVDQYRRYEKLIEQRHVEDVAATTARVEREQKRRQSAEWKTNAAKVREQVSEDINLRPDVAVDNYFADGILYGEKVDRVKIGTDFLTPEQQAGLPRDYYNKSGVHPDDLAGLFGFPTGEALVQHLSTLTEIRRQSGMRPIDFKRRLITMETDRIMEQQYGKLENNIHDATMDQVASETQLNLLAEETVALGMKSGDVGPFDKAAVDSWVKDKFDGLIASDIKVDAFMRDAGKAGKAAEMHLLKGEFAEAFQQKQRQYYAMAWTAEARALEKEQAKFAKLAKRLSTREVKGLDPEFLDMAQDLMTEAGIPTKRSLAEIRESRAAYGNDSMATFIANKASDGWDLAVSEALQNGIVKPLEQMTVAEFREFNDAITSINHVGREVRKIEIAGEKVEWAEFRKSIVDNITELPARLRESQGRFLYKIDASLTRMEEIVKDLDLRKELGPLYQAVIEPMMKSKSKEFDLLTDLSKHFQETRGEFGREWRKKLGQSINQDVLADPYTQAPYDMTRENLIQVMLNWGNRSNIDKLVNGAGLAKFGRRLTKEERPVYEAQIKALIDQHATAEDWQFVQRMWEPFKGWQKQMDTVSRNTSGVTPKWVDVGQVETPHGKFEGGYWPVKYDRLGSNAMVIEDRKPIKDGVFSSDYFRAATSKGYLKERTGYVDFVDISTSLEQAAGTMQQTIHDIAFRDALIQGSKVFYDKEIRATIRKHYGAEYEAQLIPWLRRIASQYTVDDASISGYNDFLRRTRINLVGHALPLNLKVILSPDVGVPNPKAWVSFEANRTENSKLAMEKSNEIRHLVYNMDRDYRESLDKITANPNVSDLQKKAIQWGFAPVAKVSQEFRMSTFVDKYREALGDGRTEAEAVSIADSYVRERHGAASVVDLPSIMQSSEGMKMLTMFYGYFNTMYNWQRQMPGNVRRGEMSKLMTNGLGSVVVGAAFGAALFNTRKEDDSWWKIMGKALMMQPLSTIPILNSVSSYAFEGFSPRTPFASLLGAAGSIVTDTKKAWNKKPIEKPIQHVGNVIGLSTGLPLAQIARTGQFSYDVAKGKQKPRNIAEWSRGIITGEARLKK